MAIWLQPALHEQGVAGAMSRTRDEVGLERALEATEKDARMMTTMHLRTQRMAATTSLGRVSGRLRSYTCA